MIARLFQALTGRPWTTVRSCTAEFGPPPGARYAAELAAYSDAELITGGHTILARLRREDQVPAAVTPAGSVRPTPARRTTPAPARTDARVITAVGGGWT
jgi:hypothetical protein